MKALLGLSLFIVTCTMSNAALASTTRGDRQHHDVDILKWAADMYFIDNGQCPATDPSSTWFQKLDKANYIGPTGLSCGTPEGAPLPLDLFGQPLVYELPTPTVPNSAVVRCIGRDHGAGDDLDSRYGPNFGYWNKAAWPKFFTWLTSGSLVAVVASVIAWFIWRRARISIAALLVFAGVGVGIVVASQFSAGFFRTTASRLPSWGDALCLWSCFGLPVGAGLTIWMTIGAIIRRRGRVERGLCPNCAYPIGTSAVCTECGILLPPSQ